MLDRSLRATFGNFTTLALIAATFSVPASLIYCFFFRKAIAVSELHDAILGFKGHRQAAGVGRDTLVTARWVGWGLVLLSLALLPYLVRAVRRVLEREAEDEVATVPDSLRNAPAGKPSFQEAATANRSEFLVGALAALAVGLLVLQVGISLSDLLSESRLWVGVGLSRGLAWAVAVPFVLVPWALSSRT
jgi:Na+-transporting methylmalonyl-CoA/oxaloacetate decarboxylase gamma subunit